ncbi:hypothetical protein EVG20_g8568 [Dentipellis fragilis]|uniref:Uncharacterized protein n=1 Tax=Dentipellis fragilis TaxID=205917 RepID=A0A4Y9Y6H7_9AGAM|nr:hypothetical protein EVG20_g8568 [Dentipellis fragilis]
MYMEDRSFSSRTSSVHHAGVQSGCDHSRGPGSVAEVITFCAITTTFLRIPLRPCLFYSPTHLSSMIPPTPRPTKSRRRVYAWIARRQDDAAHSTPKYTLSTVEAEKWMETREVESYVPAAFAEVLSTAVCLLPTLSLLPLLLFSTLHHRTISPASVSASAFLLDEDIRSAATTRERAATITTSLRQKATSMTHSDGRIFAFTPGPARSVPPSIRPFTYQ